MFGATALASGQRRLDSATPDYDAQDAHSAAVWRLIEPGGDYDPQAADNFAEALTNIDADPKFQDAVRAFFAGQTQPLRLMVEAYWLQRAEERIERDSRDYH